MKKCKFIQQKWSRYLPVGTHYVHIAYSSIRPKTVGRKFGKNKKQQKKRKSYDQLKIPLKNKNKKRQFL